MLLIDLLKVMDLDTRIDIEYNYETIYEGTVEECRGYSFLEKGYTVRSIWYSHIYNAIMIQI